MQERGVHICNADVLAVVPFKSGTYPGRDHLAAGFVLRGVWFARPPDCRLGNGQSYITRALEIRLDPMVESVGCLWIGGSVYLFLRVDPLFLPVHILERNTKPFGATRLPDPQPVLKIRTGFNLTWEKQGYWVCARSFGWLVVYQIFYLLNWAPHLFWREVWRWFCFFDSPMEQWALAYSTSPSGFHAPSAQLPQSFYREPYPCCMLYNATPILPESSRD